MASANSLIVFDAAGHAIGYYQGTCNNSDADWKVYSLSGYFACVEVTTGTLDSSIELPGGAGTTVSESGFSESECVGARYAFSDNTGVGAFYGGFVLAGLHDRAAYTKNDGQLAVLQNLYSDEIPLGSACATFSNPPIAEFALPVFDNDSSVTGFSNVAYKAPLRIQPASDTSLSDVIFFDSFE